ncbi:DNA polymerase III subunit gamma and tau [Litorihabitans aurantiacus]|uniref:DNA polymerase III subunit gamma/tau n=1 Tax=Litorihabitans aurantiacus TaxID=1930061 RepID=A0AA38CSY6_9MICO|nr:DNA polymerase III subunit gamma and tau [Litorihabitans aurantiacus]GMA32621.1 hypothetical protein GCM10025875_26130 [Litorihabitans aurantiacus]
MTTALYRRYRPDSFADVIGQEHVTDPLRAALRADRATHAYLFSGPRGCGKTTSARILARCLNCAKGPTDTPCGVCESCVELARGGPGSLDVVEIDAASHGGVDDARDLRERAVFAPARDRYKVFIIDEAHMVTPQGFNALLKLVEEPPAHVKFVFATTEPDKVIGTIRSRTHHYPFRLVPPAVLQGYLGTLCEAEHIAVESGVLPLVVRAGGGSVRDSLSVLDQLMAGAADDGVSYDLASALLGFTPVTLLDDAVGALAAGDGAALFRVVDHVVESGRDPRRFVEDLLDRLRDLIVIVASGAEAETVLRALPADEVERMRPQAAALGAHRLSTAADIVNAGLTDMVGATSPRLLLELVLTRAMLAIGGLREAAVSGAPIATVVPPAAPSTPARQSRPATTPQAPSRGARSPSCSRRARRRRSVPARPPRPAMARSAARRCPTRRARTTRGARSTPQTGSGPRLGRPRTPASPGVTAAPSRGRDPSRTGRGRHRRRRSLPRGPSGTPGPSSSASSPSATRGRTSGATARASTASRAVARTGPDVPGRASRASVPRRRVARTGPVSPAPPRGTSSRRRRPRRRTAPSSGAAGPRCWRPSPGRAAPPGPSSRSTPSRARSPRRRSRSCSRRRG